MPVYYRAKYVQNLDRFRLFVDKLNIIIIIENHDYQICII